ncbi:MAG: low molecular weight protein-tyrosine-phosphatase [Pseudomonadota bacterium]
MTRVLFVCLGNICRSPTAEGVARHLAAEAGIPADFASAGTGAWHLGDPPYGPAQRAAAARGYDLSQMRARKFQAADYEEFDLILAMDDDNLAAVEAQRPRGSQTLVRRFAQFAEGPETAIPDPYYSGDFDGALNLIERASTGLVAALRSGQF